MAKTAMSQLEDQVELIRREAFAAGYAAAMRAVHEIASRPAPAENLPTPTAPTRRGRPPRQPQPAPREAQASQPRADSKPAAKRLDRRQQQYSGVRGQPAAVESDMHRLPRDRWQTRQNPRTFVHGGRTPLA